jgi:hypothetical protein
MKINHTPLLAVAMLATGIGIGAVGSQSIIAPASAQSFQQRSNWSVWHARHEIEHEISLLSGDARDYGGHKAAAMNDLQAARGELLTAERFARDHGY